MRLFIAIQFTDEIKDALEDAIEDLRAQRVRANFTPTENLHLTLAFLGEVPAGKVAAIEEAIERVGMPEMELAIGGVGNFGNLLWIGVEENRALKDYVRELRRSLTENGITFDTKPFRAHITIARKVQGTRAFDVHMRRVSMRANCVSLMRSDRTDYGMQYTELSCFCQGSLVLRRPLKIKNRMENTAP